VIALADLLYLYLCRYPGCLSPDSIWQMEQVLGVKPYSNHHPFWHTILIKGIVDLGMLLFHDLNAAVALYSTIQVLFFAACCSYTVTTMWQCGISKGWIFFAFILYAFTPYHLAFNITMRKDVVFGCAALLFVTDSFRQLPFSRNFAVPIRSLRYSPPYLAVTAESIFLKKKED